MSGEDADLLNHAARWKERGLGVAIATVVSTQGSAPRPVGSLLVVNEQQAFAGSVSGGCVEGSVIREALLAIVDGEPRVLEYGISSDRAWEVGLACGGTVQVLVRKLPASEEFLPRLLADVAARSPVVVVTDLASDEVRLVHPLATNPGLDPGLAAAARAAAERDESAKLEISGRTWFLRVFNPPVRVVLVGAVHIAQSLVRLVELAGYEAVVVDPRPAFATEARFEGVALVRKWPDEALGDLGIDRRTAIVTMTHDPKLDDPALAAALRSEAFYVGALGSRKTHAARRERLRAMGFDDADLARIRAPVGLPIGARSPAEIAVAIVAQIISVLRVHTDRERATP